MQYMITFGAQVGKFPEPGSGLACGQYSGDAALPPPAEIVRSQDIAALGLDTCAGKRFFSGSTVVEVIFCKGWLESSA